MPTFAELIEVAYKKERASGRRQAKKLAISEEDALRKVMETQARARSLEALVDERRQQAAKMAEKVASIKQLQANARAKKALEKIPDRDAWLAWFDGATHPNPGKMGIGGMLKNPDGELVTSISFAAGHGDSSIAEYMALIAVLQAAIDANSRKLVVYGDSRVVLDDIQTKTAGAAALASHRAYARQLAAQLGEVRFIWIPRHKNGLADALSQQAVKLPAMHLP